MNQHNVTFRLLRWYLKRQNGWLSTVKMLLFFLIALRDLLVPTIQLFLQVEKFSLVVLTLTLFTNQRDFLVQPEILNMADRSRSWLQHSSIRVAAWMKLFLKSLKAQVIWK